MSNVETSSSRLVSIVIPARNEEANVGKVVQSILEQRPQNVDLEVIVVDDGSEDRTGVEAEKAGATVLRLKDETCGGNPAVARNRGAAASRGDPIVFLDCDCIPDKGWLRALLHAHTVGAEAVGGSLALPSGLSVMARCDYYCGWYHVHPKQRGGFVTNHPPCNISVQRVSFESTRGFLERPPVAYSHEELAWQAELQNAGGTIFFDPTARVYHYNRPGLGNLLRRNYRWGYGAIEAKADVKVVRFQWIYRYPYFLIAGSMPLAMLSTMYVIACWLRAGVVEPFLLWPVIFAARVAYSAGIMVGGIRWLNRRGTLSVSRRPRWE